MVYKVDEEAYAAARTFQERAASVICRLLSREPQDGDEMTVCALLHGLAGLNVMRGEFLEDWEAEEPLEKIYALKPWEYGDYFTRKALFAVAKETTLHAPSFELLLHLIVWCKEAIVDAFSSGARGVKAEEELLMACHVEAQEYLRDTSLDETEGAAGNLEFRHILDRWRDHDLPEINELVQDISREYLGE